MPMTADGATDDLAALLWVQHLFAGVIELLLYGNGTLFQALEGDEPIVAKLYEKIASDPRHCDVTCLSRKTIDKRAFPGWSMGFRRLSGANATDPTQFVKEETRKALLANFAAPAGLRPTTASASVPGSEREKADLSEALRRAEGALEIARLALEDIVEAHDAGSIGDAHGKVCRFALGQVNAIQGARVSG